MTILSPDELAAPLEGGGVSSLQQPSSGRRADTIFKGVALAAGLVVLAVLGLIAVSTTREAWPAFQQEGLGFVTSQTWVPADNQFGALAFIYGTMLSSVLALFLAVPVSLGIALFANEAAPRRLRRPVVYLMDLLAAIPSVVYGLWGIIVLAPAIQPVYRWIDGAVGSWPVLGWFFSGQSGRSYMTAGIILAIMITPIITSLSREVIATVPSAQREAAYGMGATRWEMIRGAVFPHSRSGIVAGVLLGFGRAIGETIAVALVIGSSPQITAKLFNSGDALSAVIANQFGESTGTYQAALIGMGVLLFGLTLVISMIARGVIHRAERRIGAASA